MLAIAPSPSPYLLENPPTSSGRTLLAVALEHYCLLMWGFSGADIAHAFDAAEEASGNERKQVQIAAGLIGRLLADGVVKSFARPIGGGEPTIMRTSLWELDDFSARFASSGLALDTPFDGTAPRSHWIFVDTADFDMVMEASFADPARPRRGARGPAVVIKDAGTQSANSGEQRLVRLPEVKRRTGLARSTIYARMETGRFPQTVPISGNIAAWRESDLEIWLADPR